MSARGAPGARGCAWLLAVLLAAACGGSSTPGEPLPSADAGTGGQDGGDAGTRADDPFADGVVSFQPGESAGFGQERLPEVVLGPPRGGGSSMGSLDVLSLGRGGSIFLELTDLGVVDGPGVDLLVFENPFGQFVETGFVAVSDDGASWHEFPCDPTDVDGGYPGCAGVAHVHSSPDNGISPTDPAVAGGDGFDLATLGLSRARYLRIRDSGANVYGGTSGGFDLDAISVVNGSPLREWPP